jgi:hypothetical protein
MGQNGNSAATSGMVAVGHRPDRPSRRIGRPSLLGAVGRTSVVAGSATMISHVVQSSPPEPAGEPDLIDRLSRLAELRASGDLSEWEFERAKARLLA